MNWREADRTKLTEKTKNAVIVMEILFTAERELLKNALIELKEFVYKYCGGDVNYFILDKNNPLINL